MSHIDNTTRATKAYHILADATNVHLNLIDMIDRLTLYGGSQHLLAAYKALTGETRKSIHPQKLVRQFYHALDITGGSLEEKIDLLNEFGNDIYLDDVAEYRHEVEQFGAPYELAGDVQ